MSSEWTERRPSPLPPTQPHARAPSFVSEISDVSFHDGPDTEGDNSGASRDSAQYAPSDRSSDYRGRLPSLDGGSAYEQSRYAINGTAKFTSPSIASENGDASLSEVADAYRNHAILTGRSKSTGDGRRTPRGHERGGLVTSDVIDGLRDEIGLLRNQLEEEGAKREEMRAEFDNWREML